MFETSEDTRLIMARLKEANIGETVTDTQLAKAVGKPIEAVKSAIASARYSLRRDDRIVFDRLRKRGYERLSSEKIVEASSKDILVVRRHARRSVSKLICAEHKHLTPRGQLNHLVRLTAFTAIAAAASDAGLKSVASGVGSDGGRLPIHDFISGLTKRSE